MIYWITRDEHTTLCTCTREIPEIRVLINVAIVMKYLRNKLSSLRLPVLGSIFFLSRKKTTFQECNFFHIREYVHFLREVGMVERGGCNNEPPKKFNDPRLSSHFYFVNNKYEKALNHSSNGANRFLYYFFQIFR